MGVVSKRVQGWQLLNAIAEVIASCILFGFMLLIWRMNFALIEDNYPIYLLLVVVTIGANNLYQINQPEFIEARSSVSDSAQAFKKTFLVSLVWFGFLAARQDLTVSRMFLFAFLICLTPCLILTNFLAKKYFAPLVFSSRHQFSVILIGDLEGQEKLVAWLSSKKSLGIILLGYLSDNIEVSKFGLSRLGGVADINKVLEATNAGLVVSLSLPENDTQATELRETCDRVGVRLAFQCRFGADIASRLSFCQAEGVTMLYIRSEPLQCPFNRIVKRTIDIAIAVPVVVVVLPPLALLVWLIQRIYSPGPLLFKQQRGGLGGRSFTLLKFRTMHCHLANQVPQTVNGDTRIYKGGAWLRKSSIDEFPQFLNVLVGSMSVVGPRPHLCIHDLAFSRISSEYHIRAHIKPGITGLAQVQGHRGPTPENHHVNARVKADLKYMENWTFTTDFIIVFRTILHLLHPRNAV
jgi:exopolysaccharide biosynthesis polyprenyl glycosylphosphotransferase